MRTGSKLLHRLRSIKTGQLINMCNTVVNPVTVYHGTTEKRYLQILKDGEIKVTTEEICNYPTTTCKFVYVTKRLCDAMDFSSRTAENGKSTIIVFRIVVDQSALLKDSDEIKWRSTLSTDGARFCYRIGRNLKLGEDVIAVFRKPFGTNSKACGNYLQAVQYGELEVPDTEWHML